MREQGRRATHANYRGVRQQEEARDAREQLDSIRDAALARRARSAAPEHAWAERRGAGLLRASAAGESGEAARASAGGGSTLSGATRRASERAQAARPYNTLFVPFSIFHRTQATPFTQRWRTPVADQPLFFSLDKLIVKDEMSFSYSAPERFNQLFSCEFKV